VVVVVMIVVVLVGGGRGVAAGGGGVVVVVMMVVVVINHRSTSRMYSIGIVMVDESGGSRRSKLNFYLPPLLLFSLPPESLTTMSGLIICLD